MRVFVLAFIGLHLIGCTDDKVVPITYCRTDADCPEGYLCDSFQCVPRESKSCTNVINGKPILQPAPHLVDFGVVDSQAALVKTVALHNIGDCTLTLFEATLGSGTEGFTCDLCDTSFPKEIFPGRSIEVSVGYAPGPVQASSTELKLLSDDADYPTLRVPVRAQYIGTPSLVAAPNPVDFGYTAEGRLSRRSITLSNQGTGTAPLTITQVKLLPADTMDFALVDPTDLPRTLAPVAQDRTAVESIEVRYTPRTLADHIASVEITTSVGVFSVALKGTSASAPSISVTPAEIDLGDVTLGTGNFKTFTIVNGGGAPLTVHPSWGSMMFTTDFSLNPQIIPDVAPTKYVEVQVLVTATREGPLQSILNLESNDPLHPTVSIPVRARGVPGASAEVVKLEMTFDNGKDNSFDSDVRNVDMTLEHPFGYVCNRLTPSPTNWGNYGSPSWFAFAPKEEPERIILADAHQDGTYRVLLTYQNDCASLPTSLMAGILGVSVEVLISYLTGGIPIPGTTGSVAGIIKDICFNQEPTSATVKVYINGALIAEKNASLGAIGDSVYALDLVRQSGTFKVP